jgi:BirA family transcriptional regulator, biotin operon repressor / biotin---[acetyl-CoA-carboxylase] ligase
MAPDLMAAMRRFHFDVTDSTNTQARRLGAEHPGEPLLVTATEQSAGRGRNGRTWHSPMGGAWLSVAWPRRRSAAAYAAVGLVAAAAVRRALVDAAPEVAERLRIKWPNDLLLDDGKVAGILCEQSPDGAGDPGVLIVGVGVNVDFDSATLPGDLRRPATTLRDALGRSVLVETIIGGVAARLAEVLADFEANGIAPALLDELRAHLADVGTHRTWDGPAGRITGVIRGIDDAGRLLLEGPDGPLACETGELAN